MDKVKIVGLALAGALFPLGLALAVYATSATPLSAAGPTVALTQTIARPSENAPPVTSTREQDAGTTTTSTVDESGNCDEAEHRLDPECVDGTTTDEEDSDGGSNSGSGSDNSGSGSGDD